MDNHYLVETAVPCPVDRAFSYLSEKDLKAGCRVRVPFGSRVVAGIVLSSHKASAEELDQAKTSGKKLKWISEEIDQEPVMSPTLIRLSKWLSQYYMHPIGEVVRAMTPTTVSYQKTGTVMLTQRGKEAVEDGSVPESRLLAYLFQNRARLSLATLKKKIKDFAKQPVPEASQAQVLSGEIDLAELVQRKLVQLEVSKNPVFRKQQEKASGASSVRAKNLNGSEFRNLTPGQQNAFLKMGDDLKAPEAPWLLRGITGSGKTEVYLHMIRKLWSTETSTDGILPQILVLVPEISLTPQTTKVFEERFPGRVAVVHSGLSDLKRWKQLEAIRTGEAGILIGPRSAVFAPFCKLRLIVVDEEHDHSYKQHQGFRYHGRDVAVLRGRLENALVILGSATPSLESLYNSQIRRYKYVEIPERASGFQLPQIRLIGHGGADLRRTGKMLGRGFEIPEDSGNSGVPGDVREALKETLSKGEQAIVLVNRRGYSGFLYDPSEKVSLTCDSCSVSLTLHKHRQGLLCHYCGYQVSLKALKERNPQKRYIALGYGSQRIEEALSDALPEARIGRMDSDTTLKKGATAEILEKFRQKELDVLTGTQMLAKGHDFPDVTLSVLLEVDQMLNLPDFRAAERVFQMIVQTAGRSGRGEKPGHVLLQTEQEGSDLIRSAMNHDFHGFSEAELSFRKLHEYPPFGKMILFEFSSLDKQKLERYGQLVARLMNEMAMHHKAEFSKVRILGPVAPPVERINGRFRKTILFSSSLESQVILRQTCQLIRRHLPRAGAEIRLNIDVDPQSLI